VAVGAAGLRREELAGLAGISVDYLTRLEQGRATSPVPAPAGTGDLAVVEAQVGNATGSTGPVWANVPT